MEDEEGNEIKVGDGEGMEVGEGKMNEIGWGLRSWLKEEVGEFKGEVGDM